MSILISSTCRLLGYQLFHNTMEKSYQILRLEERLDRTEKSVLQIQKEINQMKNDLRCLKAIEAIKEEVEPIQKRSFSTLSRSFDDCNVDNKKSKFSFDRNDNGSVIVYTDGACTSNGQKGAKAGIGVWFGDNHPLNVSMPCPGRQTNNTAEILACAEACKVAASNGIDKLEINTDSKFTIDCVTKWIKGWKKNNWKTSTGKDVINKDDVLILEMAAKALSSVSYKHVNGHQGIKGNEAADRLAVQGANATC